MTQPKGTDPQQDMRAIMDHYAPASVVYAGESLQLLIENWQTDHPETHVLPLPEKHPQQAFPLPRLFDLALVAHTLEHLSREDGKLLLGQMRNMGATRMAVLVSADSDWSFQDFIGLGFTRLHRYGKPAQHLLYAYDIATYNRKREWNTPENWANPEMWDKARW